MKDMVLTDNNKNGLLSYHKEAHLLKTWTFVISMVRNKEYRTDHGSTLPHPKPHKCAR